MNNFVSGSDAQATEWRRQQLAGAIRASLGAANNDDDARPTAAFKAIPSAGESGDSGSDPPSTHTEPLTDGQGNFIFAGGDIVVVVGVPNS
jgi:hypothetical protein